MNKHFLLLRLFICIFIAGLTLFFYVEKQNQLTELRLALPLLAKKVHQLQEENLRLKYEIDRFESPLHLMELTREPAYGHLKYPFLNEQIFIGQESPHP